MTKKHDKVDFRHFIVCQLILLVQIIGGCNFFCNNAFPIFLWQYYIIVLPQKAVQIHKYFLLQVVLSLYREVTYGNEVSRAVYPVWLESAVLP